MRIKAHNSPTAESFSNDELMTRSLVRVSDGVKGSRPRVSMSDRTGERTARNECEWFLRLVGEVAVGRAMTGAKLPARGDSMIVLSQLGFGAFPIQPSPEGDRVLLLGNGNSERYCEVPEAGAVLTTIALELGTP
jgi:hypothetical protein